MRELDDPTAVPRDVAQVLRIGCERTPDDPALITRSGSLSYRELDAEANRAARALARVGVRRGDRLAACLPNDHMILCAFHGAQRLGAVWVGVNQALAAPEQAYILSDSGSMTILCERPTAEALKAHRGSLPDLQRVLVIDGSDSGNDGCWAEVVGGQSADPLGGEVDPLAPAAISYTSGTTGYPKGAVHSQYNLLLPGAQIVRSRGYDSALRKGDCFPLTILNMMVLTTLLTAQAGGRAVIMDTLAARDIAGWIEREQVQVWNGPPALLYTMAHDDQIQPDQLASLREVWVGGGDCPQAIRDAFEAKFSLRVCGTYGLTEAPTVVTIEAVQRGGAPPSSGAPLPHLEVSIRDEAGRPIKSGGVGEVCVSAKASSAAADTADRAPEVYRPMLGYWNKPEQTDEALRDGVLHTGDAGLLDADGFLHITDRLSLMLNRGGANVYPAEVERVATAAPGVQACAVFGIPDERLGQRVGILVEPQPGNDTFEIELVLSYCQMHLGAYKVPEFIAVVEALPRNAMGKIDRKALAELGEASGLTRLPLRRPSSIQSSR